MGKWRLETGTSTEMKRKMENTRVKRREWPRKRETVIVVIEILSAFSPPPSIPPPPFNECNRCAFYAFAEGGKINRRDPEARKLRTMRRPRRKKLLFAPASAYAYGWLRCVYPGDRVPRGIQDMRSRGFDLATIFVSILLSRVPVSRLKKRRCCRRRRWRVPRSRKFGVLPFEWNIFHEDCALMCTTLNYLVDGVLWLCRCGRWTKLM